MTKGGRVRGGIRKGKTKVGSGKRHVKGFMTNNSIKWKSLYAKLRGKGKSKSSAARISNAAWNNKKH